MAVYNVPGVFLSEVDLSSIVPNFSTTTGAIVGYSEQGDAENVRLITNTQQFVQEYGEPKPGQYFHYSALAFLSMGNALYCYRAQKNALFGGVSIAVTGGTNFSFVAGRLTRSYADDSNYPDALFYIYGKDPGVWNNSLGIRISNIQNAPVYTFDIEVYDMDADGNYVRKELFTVSRKQQKDGYGRQQYMETRINGSSQYIWVSDNTDELDTVMPKSQTNTLAMAGGGNGDATSYVEINADRKSVV